MITILLFNLIKCLSFTGTADAPIMIDENIGTEMCGDKGGEEKELKISQEGSALDGKY
ncbi:unnamed protein product [Meloidogyne enterolobii]|uniref:Uncharacterized protein n=1 Tax=Meloidogyne enterolobii TaxID=390850 RepID=A0ACB0YDQ4_MELEN